MDRLLKTVEKAKSNLHMALLIASVSGQHKAKDLRKDLESKMANEYRSLEELRENSSWLREAILKIQSSTSTVAPLPGGSDPAADLREHGNEDDYAGDDVKLIPDKITAAATEFYKRAAPGRETDGYRVRFRGRVQVRNRSGGQGVASSTCGLGNVLSPISMLSLIA